MNLQTLMSHATETYLKSCTYSVCKDFVVHFRKPESDLDFWEMGKYKEVLADLGSYTYLRSSLEEFIYKHDYRLYASPYRYIEHTSSNPVGPIHLGNILNGLCGDFYARLLHLKPGYYLNDLGKNYVKYCLEIEKGTPFLDAYLKSNPSKEEIEDYSLKLYTKAKESKLKKVITFRELLKEPGPLKPFLVYLKDFCKTLNLKKPFFVRDSAMIESLDLLLKNSNLLDKQADGSTVFKGTDIIVKTKEDRLLYLLPTWHYIRTFQKIKGKKIIFFGPDHRGFVNTLEKILPNRILKDWLFLFNPKIQKKEEKMSKRTGNTATAYTLKQDLEKIGFRKDNFFVANYLRFIILKYWARDLLDYEFFLEKKNLFEFCKYQKIFEKTIIPQNLDLKKLWPISPSLFKLGGSLNFILMDFINKNKFFRVYKLIDFLRSYKTKDPAEKNFKNIILKKILLRLGFY